MTIEKSPIYPFSQITEQKVNYYNEHIFIQVADEVSNGYCPTFYYDPDDRTKTLTECTVEKGVASYSIPETISNGEYTIYYKLPCSDELETTGIKIIVNIIDIPIEKITITNGNTCTVNTPSSITLTASEVPILNIYSAVLRNKETEKKYTFACSYNNTVIICEREITEEPLIGGTYALEYVKGDVRYTLNLVSQSVIKVDTLGYQMTQLQYYKKGEINFFHVILASETIKEPEIYMNKDGEENHRIPCERAYEDDKKILKCTPNEILFPTEGKYYEIYYMGYCRRIQSTGINIQKLSSDINVFHMTNVSRESYSYRRKMFQIIVEPNNELIDNYPETLQADVRNPDTHSMIVFTCKINPTASTPLPATENPEEEEEKKEKDIPSSEGIKEETNQSRLRFLEGTTKYKKIAYTCKTDNSIDDEFNYYTVFMVIPEGYNVVVDVITKRPPTVDLCFKNCPGWTPTIIADLNELNYQNLRMMVVNDYITHISVQFQNQAAVPSEVFTVNPYTFVRTDFQCHKRLSRLICKSSDKLSQSNKVYYTNNIDSYHLPYILYYSGSNVVYEVTKFVREDGFTCNRNAFPSFYITTVPSSPQEKPTFYIAKKSDINTTIAFSCVGSGLGKYTFSCSNAAMTVDEDEYVLTSYAFVSPYYYDLSKVNNVIKVASSTEYIVTKEETQTINNIKKNFTLTLKNQNKIPSIFIDNDLSKEVSCHSLGTELTCNPERRLMPKSWDYQIYYMNSCGELEDTGLTVSNTITINLLNVYLTDNVPCAVGSFNSFTFTLDYLPTRNIESVTLKRIYNNEISPILIENTCTMTEGTTSTPTTVTCTLSEPLLEGEYTVMDVSNNIDIFDITNSKDVIQVWPLYIDESMQTHYQNVMKSSPSFTIILTSSEIKDVKIYVDSEDNEITSKCIQEENLLTCTPEFTEDKSYSIFFMNQCSELTSTGITVTNYLRQSIQVTNIEFTDNKQCYTDKDSVITFTLTLDKTPTGIEDIIAEFISTDSTVSFKCNGSVTSKELTCSTEISLIGTFTFNSVKGYDEYTITVLESKEYQCVNDLLDTSPSMQTVNKDNKSFIIELKPSDMTPIIYVGDTEVNCDKEDNTLMCTPSNENMPSSGDYEIYYKDTCGYVKDSGITVSYSFYRQIKVSEIYLDNKSQCSQSPFAKFYMKIEAQLTGEVTSAELLNQNTNNKITFECSNTQTLITCINPSGDITEGKYTFISIEASDSFNINDLELRYELNPLSETQTSYQTVKKSSPSFIVSLKPSSTFLPKIFASNNKLNEIPCTLTESENILSCTPDITNMPSSSEYEIYSQGPCGSIINTGITVTNILPKTITVTHISLGDDTTCHNSSFTSIKLTLDAEPTGSISNVILSSSNSDEISFSHCYYYQTTVLCEEASTITLPGTFTLKSLHGDDTFTFNVITLNKLIYELDPLGTQIEINPIIDKTTFTFTVVLSAESIATPAIYADDNGVKREISCRRDTKELKHLICTPTDSEMPESKVYQIYHTGACKILTKSGISVHHTLTSSIKVTDISAIDKTTCAIGELTQVLVTLNAVPKGRIIEANFIREEENTIFVFSKCESNSNILTCSEPYTPLGDGSYRLNSIEGDDTYNIAGVLSKKILVQSEESLISSQNEDQIVDGSHKTFVIKLSHQADSPLDVYVGNTLTKNKKVNCEMNSDELICTPSESNMPIKGKYEIYYVGACGRLYSTGITIMYNPVIEIGVINIKGFCSETPFKMIQFTLNNKPTGVISTAEIYNEDNSYIFDSCEVEGKNVNCYTNKEIVPGEYELKEVNGVDSYSISSASVKETKFVYEVDPLDKENQIEEQVINAINNTFSIALKDRNKIPEISIPDKETQCKVSNTNSLQCQFTNELTPQDKSYNVYYKSPCGASTLSTGVTVRVLISEISVTKFFIDEESQSKCTTESITQISFVLNKEPTSSIVSVSLSSSVSSFNLKNCAVKGIKVTCTTSEPISAAGEYKLKEVLGADVFNVDKVRDVAISIKEKKQILGEQSNTEPVINEINNNFTVVLASSEIEQPGIYVNENSEIECVKEEEKLICIPNKDNMPNAIEYIIYYKDQCGNLADTGIIVTNMKEEIKVDEDAIRFISMSKLIFALLLIIM